jgi:hypothetical protein
VLMSLGPKHYLILYKYVCRVVNLIKQTRDSFFTVGFYFLTQVLYNPHMLRVRCVPLPAGGTVLAGTGAV